MVAATNRRDEMGGVKSINRQPRISSACVVRTFLDQPIVGVINLVLAELAQRQRSLVSVEGNVTRGIRMLVAAESLPGDLLSAWEFVVGDVGIGRLLIVVESVATAGGDYGSGKFHIQPPPA